jgi:hypothetical protein
VRRFMTIVALVLILIIGGGLTMQLIASGGDLLPVLPTVNNPDANPTVVLPWKAEQFFLLVGFILFNLIGIAATLALIFWLIDRGLRRSRAESGNRTTTPTASTSAEG